ncbi:protein of unknown function [Ralstonia solanacearum CMR15]|nr:protein of unknown function [Ralstonia solanacearum CMR15]
MKTLSPLLITVPFLLCGCKLDLDTHSVDRYRLFESKDGLVLRLDSETGEVAQVTANGMKKLGNAPDLTPEDKALIEKYTKKPVQDLKPGESTTKGLPPGWSVKRDNCKRPRIDVLAAERVG